MVNRSNKVQDAAGNIVTSFASFTSSVNTSAVKFAAFTEAVEDFNTATSEATDELPSRWRIFKWIGYALSFLMFWRFRADIVSATYNAATTAASYMSGAATAQATTSNVSFVPGYNATTNAAQTFANLAATTQAHINLPALVTPILHV